MADEIPPYDPLEPPRPKGKAAAAGDDSAAAESAAEAPVANLQAAVSEARKQTGERLSEKVRSNGLASQELRQFIERIETLEEDKKSIADDIKDVFGEAKGRGYDTKAIRAIIRLRKQDSGERAAFEAVLDTYMAALGMV